MSESVSEAPSSGAPATQERPLPTWQTYLLAFTASACTLIIELVAGRIIYALMGV